MTVLIPSDDGFECKDCDFKSEDIFTFLDHCDISFSWGIRLSNRYTLDLFTILEEMNVQLKTGDIENIDAMIQSVALALVNASEGEQSFHKFIHEAMTLEKATELVQDIEEMLKKNEKNNKTEE